MKIFLVRHGETAGDVENRYGGDYDDHLTKKGESQAKTLAKKLEGRGIEKIFTSPRFRAKETAHILGKELDVSVEVIDSIRERNFYGILTGMKKEEARKKHLEMAEQLKNYRNTIKGAEPYEHFRQRILKAFSELTKSKYKTIAIVTHGGPISCIFRELLKIEIKKMADCAVFELRSEKGKLNLIKTGEAELL